MSIQTQIDRISGNVSAALAAVAEKGVTVPDGSNSDALAELIASIEAGGGGGAGVEPIKAFYTQPITNEIQVKNIAPAIDFKLITSSYTNTSDKISATFVFATGTTPTTYILALAIRKPTGEPTLPDGWGKCAWVEPHTSSTADQYLFIAKHTITNDEKGTTCTIEFPVTRGERNYLIVASVGDSEISTNDILTYVNYSSNYVNPEIHDNTILVCSAEATQNGTSYSGWHVDNGGYSESCLPNYGDSGALGGRLGMLYFPVLSEQPFEKPNISICRYNNNTTPTNSPVICVALRIIPRTTSRYVAVLDSE